MDFLRKCYFLAGGALTASIFSFSVSTSSVHTPSPKAPAQKTQEENTQQLYRRLVRSIFVVETLDAGGKVVVTGSGVAVAPDEIVTNRHVVEKGVGWRIRSGARAWSAIILHIDSEHDLCGLKAERLTAQPVSIRSSSTLSVGERVYALGAPEGLELTLSEGLISGLREFEGGLVVQTSAAISPGSSGGGLFDAKGQLVGITTFYLKDGQNLNFALPGDWIQSLMSRSPAAEGQLESDNPTFQALVWFQLGNISEKNGDHEQAVRAYREGIKMRPEEAGIWNNLAVVLGNLDRYSDERDAARQATRLKPDMADAWYNLGTALAHLNQDDEASKAFEEVVRLKPSDAEGWYDLGTIYRNLKRNSEAIRALQEAIRLKPEFTEAWNNLGLVYRSSGRTDEAVKAYEEAVRLKPDSAEPWYNLGATYALLGNRTKVMKVYETLRQLSPELADTFFRKYVLP